MQEKADEKASHLNEADWEELDHEFTHEVQNYFKKTTKSSTLQNVDRGSPLMSTDSKTEDSEDSINEKRAVQVCGDDVIYAGRASAKEEYCPEGHEQL